MAKKKALRYESPESVPVKPLWEVEVESSPNGTKTFRVRATDEGMAINAAVAAAYQHPDVFHILSVGKPRKARAATGDPG